MRYFPLLFAALALAGCSQTAPGEATASATPSAPATIATTNATVEPVLGVATPASAPSSSESAMADSSSECGADRAKSFIGRQDRPTTRADLAKLVGHDRIRWLGPDDAMTMDFSPERLNVMLDAQKRTITGVRCG